MEILVVAVTLALCFGADKLHTRLFRSTPEHQSGKSVRLQKMYAVFGLFLMVIGILAILSGAMGTVFLTAAGIAVILMGIGLVVYYMTFGIFYDRDTFLLTTFGKRSNTYHYREILGQKLYVIQGGSVVVELHMNDGRTVQLQSNMEGAYAFLDFAYGAWVRQKGLTEAQCGFHDPSNSLWFPTVDGEGENHAHS